MDTTAATHSALSAFVRWSEKNTLSSSYWASDASCSSAAAAREMALEQLASEAQYDELSVFFSLHRTNADSAEWVAAVVSIGRTLLRVGGERARQLIQFALRDPLTIPEIKGAMERELSTSPQADLAN